MHFLQLILGIWTLSLSVNFVVSNKTRVVGGVPAVDDQFPYQVSLRYGDKKSHTCGGSIINQRWILTAAHCIDNRNAVDFEIVVGTNSLSVGGVHYAVEAMIKHPQYSDTRNDIALMKTKTPIVYDAKVRPIGLPTGTTPAGSALILSGWGQTGVNVSDLPDKLQFIPLTSISDLDCRNKYGLFRFSVDPKTNICTFTQRGQGACFGDSGGPLVDGAEKQVGVVSWGRPCAVGKPDVFSEVQYFLPWINANIN